VAVSPCQAGDPVACELARRSADRKFLLLTLTASTATTRERLTAARDAVVAGQLLLIVTDTAGAELAQSLGIAWWRVPPSPDLKSNAAAASATSAQWRGASLLVRAGCTVVLSTGRVMWHANPFAHLAGDVDVEAAQTGSGSRGSVIGVHDPPMGWSAYGQTMTAPLLDSSVVALQPTFAAAELAAQMGHRLSKGRSGMRGDSLSMLLTRLAHTPSHDGDTRAGVSMRTLPASCFVHESSAVWTALTGRVVSSLGPSPSSAAAGGSTDDQLLAADGATSAALPGAAMGRDANDILKSASFDEARSVVLQHGCTARPRDAGGAVPRPLNDVLKPSDTFPHEQACRLDENMQSLCALLEVAAINREVLAAVSNKNIHPMLSTFLVGVARANISNAMVVALDDATAAFARKHRAHTYVRKLVSRTGSTDNHATSGLKFAILHEFISAGCSVLLSDVDVVWLQNPFTLPSLYRDADVEGMTDGWDDPSAFGYHWRGQGALRLSARNSGLFYVRATSETQRMMWRLKGRMEHEGVWDQTAYNEEMWYAALPGMMSHGVSSRVMNYYCHMNSKTLFRFMLDDDSLMARHRPVSVHINYHPEKLPRMEDVFQKYHGLGDDVDLGAGLGRPTKRHAQGGLYAWHWGVGLKAGKSCREAARVRGDDGASALASKVTRSGGVATWSGMKGLTFGGRGSLTTPWGSGSWGRLRDDPEKLFADFIGQQHVMSLHRDGWPKMVSMRCADFENVTVVFAGGAG
jgi:hypothetical protein